MAAGAAIDQQALEYILNFPGPRTDDAKRSFIALNKKINALDVKKDSVAGVAVNQAQDPYATAVKQLFPGVIYTNPMQQLKQIEQAIFKDRSLGPIGKAEAVIPKPGKKGYSAPFVPVHIKNVYHDSGYNPRDLLTDSTTLITPGSFIDPAFRDKPGKDRTRIFPAHDREIVFDSNFFTTLGFSPVSFKATILPDNSCRVTIEIDGCEAINITRDSTFNSMSDPDYFCGNPEKNNAINITENTLAGICEVKKYLISKEFSDFMQIIFSIVNMILDIGNKHTHCVFTVDGVVATRCRFMGMQSFQQINTKDADDSIDGHSAILRQIELDPGKAEEELKKTYLASCIKNNGIVKRDLNIAIIQGFFLGGKQDELGENVKGFLRRLISSIDSASSAAGSVSLAAPLDDYRAQMIKYTANTPINEKGRVVSTLKRLFCPELHSVDPIYDQPKANLGDILTSLLTEDTSKKSGKIGRSKPRFLTSRKNRRGVVSRKQYGGMNENPAGGAGGMNTDPDVSPDTEDWSRMSVISKEYLDGKCVITQEELDEGEVFDQDEELDKCKEGSLYRDMYASLHRPSIEQFENFIFRVYNHIIYIREIPLGARLYFIFQNIHIIEHMPLEVFRTMYEGLLRGEQPASFKIFEHKHRDAYTGHNPLDFVGEIGSRRNNEPAYTEQTLEAALAQALAEDEASRAEAANNANIDEGDNADTALSTQGLNENTPPPPPPAQDVSINLTRATPISRPKMPLYVSSFFPRGPKIKVAKRENIIKGILKEGIKQGNINSYLYQNKELSSRNIGYIKSELRKFTNKKKPRGRVRKNLTRKTRKI
jgi:hypothetical protein